MLTLKVLVYTRRVRPDAPPNRKQSVGRIRFHPTGAWAPAVPVASDITIAPATTIALIVRCMACLPLRNSTAGILVQVGPPRFRPPFDRDHADRQGRNRSERDLRS